MCNETLFLLGKRCALLTHIKLIWLLNNNKYYLLTSKKCHMSIIIIKKNYQCGKKKHEFKSRYIDLDHEKDKPRKIKYKS